MKSTTLIDDWAMSQKVIDWMVANLDPKARVVELGGGNGSFRIHHYFDNVITVEHDTQWARQLIAQGLPVLLCPLHQDYYRNDERLMHLLKRADVIVIDGPQGRRRLGFVRYLNEVQNGAVLIIDDSQREYMKRLLQNPTITTIVDGGRKTTIQRADNKNKPTTSPMVEQSKKPRAGSATISHEQMEEVSKEISGDESTVRKVQKTSKRRRPRKTNSRPS